MFFSYKTHVEFAVIDKMLRYPIRSFIYGFNNKLIRIEEKLVSLRRARNEPLQSSSSVRMELFSYDTPAESIVIDKTNIRLFFTDLAIN